METTGHYEDLGLLSIALGSASNAARVLEAFGDLTSAERAGAVVISQRSGLSTHKARKLLAALLLGRRAALPPRVPRTSYANAADVVASFGAMLAALDHESFFALLLDAKGRGIRADVVGRGRITECDVSTREAYIGALREGAASVVFLHNHPSGDPTPSPEDHALTQRLIAAGALLDVPMLDHIIIGREGFFSFAERRLL